MKILFNFNLKFLQSYQMVKLEKFLGDLFTQEL